MDFYKKPLFWVLVAAVLIYGYSAGWFSFLTHARDIQTPPTGSGNNTINAGKNLRITNQQGAKVYNQTSNGMSATTRNISYGQGVQYTDIVRAGVCDPTTLVCSLPSDFYKLPDGSFVSKDDVTIIMTK